MVDLNVIYPMEDCRGTSQETMQAIKHNQDRLTTFSRNIICQALQICFLVFIYVLPTCKTRDNNLSISSSVCCVPYVIAAKNSNFMASVFIDHCSDDLHMSEYHEKVTFLLKIRRKKNKKLHFHKENGFFIFIFMTVKHISAVKLSFFFFSYFTINLNYSD